MRKRILFSLFVLLPSLAFFLPPLAFATKSRLMGMGDLSIVVEDESNMINLWDFGHNPAGFLDDDKGPTMKGDFAWDTYRIRDLTYRQYSYPYTYKKCNADADRFVNWVSAAFRKKSDFAVGLEGNYRLFDTHCEHYDNDSESPGVLAVFAKSLNAMTAVGADIAYLEDKFEYRFTGLESKNNAKDRDFRAQLGARRGLVTGVTLGAVLGYDLFKPDKKRGFSNVSSLWLSGQTIVEFEDKLKLGVEAVLSCKRADFHISYLESPEYYETKKEDYYFSSITFRGIYDISSQFRLGLLYSDRELFGGFYDPFFSLDYFVSPSYVRHWGAGVSCRLSGRLLAGVEYHFRYFSQALTDEYGYYSVGRKNESLNLGVEGRISDSLFLRGGFVRSETNENPNFDRRRNVWQNKAASGLGYQPAGSNLMVECSYTYAPGKLKDSSGPWDEKSDRHIFSLSFKKMF